MNAELPSFREDDISQIPALQLLQNLGYTYLAPAEAETMRGGRLNTVLLSGILEERLRKINKIRFKGSEYEFSEGNIQAAIQAITDVAIDGLVRTNEKVYDLLILGKSLPQTIFGDTKSFPLRYVDWDNLGNNVFHVTEEFSVERTASHKTFRPDIVLFVNGIPLGVIECKRPDLEDNNPMVKGISQQIDYQKDDGIPRLYVYAQLLLAISKNDAKYAVTGSGTKFWAGWKERDLPESAVDRLVKLPLARPLKDRLFADRSQAVRRYFDDLEAGGGREVTLQDVAIDSLCSPERLLELTHRYTLFDSGERKIARYQQYFCVRRTLEAIRRKPQGPGGPRDGGIVWHTQGSGKSLTMVMIAKALALEPDVLDYKIILVTDRVDLDDQIYKTFRHCGTEPIQARTGRHLAELINGPKSRIVTTVIDKFETAVGKAGARNDSPNIFVLVDEGHRGQYGALHSKMRKGLPNACFVAFTGTPVAKREKNTIRQFGGLIDTYRITDAVKDKAVVPLLYEGRNVEQRVDRDEIDRWFERETRKLTPRQKADLKKKFATSKVLNRTEKRIKEIAYDISIHFSNYWQGTPFKAQLVAPSKVTALLFKKFLDDVGMVTSEVLISGPDEHEGNDDIYDESTDAVVAFWKKMMEKYGSERAYNTNVINAFKNADQPEIIIVVNKLLTGFDAPRNVVLYLARELRDHTLLQAIARVNRLYDGKDFGFIVDYEGVLQSLDKALDLYGKLADFDAGDLDSTITDVAVEIASLPDKHTELWSCFGAVKNKHDEEAFEQALFDQADRDQFYEQLSCFARTLGIAMSSAKFVAETPDATIDRYQEDLKFFMKLRSAVKRRFSDVVNFKEYEPRIQKLLDTHVGTGEVQQVSNLVNIFDPEFAAEVQRQRGDASKADTIAHRMKKTISERWEEDRALYRKFSEMIEEAIRAYREGRLSAADYLRKVTEVKEALLTRKEDDLPPKLVGNDNARAYYHEVAEMLNRHSAGFDAKDVAADAGLKLDGIIQNRRIVGWSTNSDVQNRMRLEIEDYLHELMAEKGFQLGYDEIDTIIEGCLAVARRRCP
jgi:type I restriction enzyme, R subunit